MRRPRPLPGHQPRRHPGRHRLRTAQSRNEGGWGDIFGGFVNAFYNVFKTADPIAIPSAAVTGSGLPSRIPIGRPAMSSYALGGAIFNIATLFIPGVDEANAIEETGAGATRVGRWMGQNEFDQMSNTGRVQEGAGGRTYVSNPPDPNVWRGAAPGSIYAEFEVPTSSLFRAGNPGWDVIPGPNVTTGLYGPPPLLMPNATSIEWMFAK